jgi:23S rRNA (cytosine1962-C5)-methyltransferase
MSPAPASDVARCRELLDAALDRRAAVTEVTDAYRWVDDEADGFPGVIVDRYADFAVLLVEEQPAALVETLAAALGERTRGVYLKRRRLGDPRRAVRCEIAPETPLVGEPAPPELVVVEHGMRFGVALADGMSTGLFTDQRENRQRVGSFSRGARVLNLFSYTGSFSVAAALGGATETVSVDLSKRALDRARANFERNDVAKGHRFVHDDAVAYVARAARRREKFDVVVLDPPSFGTGGRKTFSVERDYPSLAAQAVALLGSGGRLLAVTNHRRTSPERLRGILAAAALEVGREVRDWVEPPTPADHRHRPGGAPVAKSILLTVA